mgnify:CR=1 FL=1
MGDAYPAKRLVALNEKGRRIGEDHPCAVLTNHEVDIVFILHEEGWGCRRIARKLEVSRALIRKILKGELRGQFPARFKLILEG